MHTYHYTLVQTHSMHNTKGKPEDKLYILVYITYLHIYMLYIILTNVPLLWEMLVMRRLQMYGGRRYVGKSLNLSLNVLVNLKLL